MQVEIHLVLVTSPVIPCGIAVMRCGKLVEPSQGRRLSQREHIDGFLFFYPAFFEQFALETNFLNKKAADVFTSAALIFFTTLYSLLSTFYSLFSTLYSPFSILYSPTSSLPLPPRNIRLPLRVIRNMPPEDIRRICGRFLGKMQQTHVRLLHLASALAMITGRASRHQIRPGLLPAQMTRRHVVNGQRHVAPAVTLTSPNFQGLS